MSKEGFVFLQDWAFHYIKLKDIVAGKILNIDKTNYGLKVLNNDNTESFVVVQPIIESFDKVFELKVCHVTLVVLNAKVNLDALIKNWDALAQIENLMLVFVNPFSITDEKWVVCPYVHAKIADPATLELGLKTMFECVEETSLDDFLSRIKK